jgi:hypothetical protein
VTRGGDANDEGRFLDRRVFMPPTSELRNAVWDEPELISAADERRLADDARRRDCQQRAVAWKTAHTTIVEAIATFKQTARVDPRLDSDLRVLVRQCERVGQRVRAARVS